jgi:GT2 family glycosyltransferase
MRSGRAWRTPWRISKKLETIARAMMLASVIILNWNGLEVLGPCLAAIEANTAMEDYEVIVLDNGSAQGGVEEVTRPFAKVRLVKEPVNHGFSRGNNIAAKHARGEYLVILNNDTIPERDWLRPLVEAVRSDVGIAGAKLVNGHGRVLFAGAYFNPAIAAYTPAFRNFPAQAAALPRECEAYIACGIAIRRDVFEAVGGFDENYFQGYEDIDLCLKVRERGLRIMYCPESVIQHIENVSMNKMKRGAKRRSKESNRAFFDRRWRHRIHEFRLPSLPAGLDDFAAHEILDTELLDAVPAKAGAVLHISCGTGTLGERLKALGKASRVTGIEAELSAAEIARSRLDDVFSVDANSEIPQALRGQFDTLVVSTALERATDPWALLFRLRDCLRARGVIVARFHNIAHYKMLKRLTLREWRYEPSGILHHGNLRFFSKGSIEDLLVFAGFENMRIEPAGKLSAADYVVTAAKRGGA